MPEGKWEFAVIGIHEARTARIMWNPGLRLPAELVWIAERLGYSTTELASYDLGELTDDLEADGEVYLRGALVLPDEHGIPSALFGKPLLRESCNVTPTYVA